MHNPPMTKIATAGLSTIAPTLAAAPPANPTYTTKLFNFCIGVCLTVSTLELCDEPPSELPEAVLLSSSERSGVRRELAFWEAIREAM